MVGIVGNAFEWMEFTIYTSLGILIAEKFFPSSDSFSGLLRTYMVLALGFFARPIGGVIFGYIGDVYGRKKALLISIVGMIIPTLIMASLPTYQSIGLAAPLILCLIRLIQGLTLGGDAGGIYSYLAENSGANNKSFICSIGLVGNSLGFLLGILVINFVKYTLTEEVFHDWGWRVPFFISLIFGLLAVYLRSKIQETKEISHPATRTNSSLPIINLIKNYKKLILVGIISYAPAVSSYFMVFVFLRGFMTSLEGHTEAEFINISLIALVCYIVTVPFCAFVADKVGIKKYSLVSLILLVTIIYPAFSMISNEVYLMRIFGVIFLAVLSAIYTAPMPAFLTTLFPTSIRYTGVALSLNISAAIFGGAMPYISGMLILYTGHSGSVPLFIAFLSIIAFFTLYRYFQTARDQN